jgi:hypothetical protein
VGQATALETEAAVGRQKSTKMWQQLAAATAAVAAVKRQGQIVAAAAMVIAQFTL